VRFALHMLKIAHGHYMLSPMRMAPCLCTCPVWAPLCVLTAPELQQSLLYRDGGHGVSHHRHAVLVVDQHVLILRACCVVMLIGTWRWGASARPTRMRT
jgi:hypothetical protein